MSQKAGGKWDPDKIHESILVYYEQAHELDEARILNSRGHRLRPHGVHFVKHNPPEAEGTDLTPDFVEEYDQYLDLDTDQKVFDSTNPVYLTNKDDEHEATDDEQEPQCVMFTTTPYEQEYDEHSSSGSEECDDMGSEGSEESSEQDSESVTDEDDLADAIGDVYEQGYLEALQGQNLQPEEGLSASQREVFLTTWKGARKFGGRSQSRDRKSKSSRRPGTQAAKTNG